MLPQDLQQTRARQELTDSWCCQVGRKKNGPQTPFSSWETELKCTRREVRSGADQKDALIPGFLGSSEDLPAPIRKPEAPEGPLAPSSAAPCSVQKERKPDRRWASLHLNLQGVDLSIKGLGSKASPPPRFGWNLPYSVSSWP